MDDPAAALLRHILFQAAVLRVDGSTGRRVDGAPMHLLVPVPPALAGALAVWGVDRENQEDAGDWEDSDDVAPGTMLRQLQICKPALFVTFRFSWREKSAPRSALDAPATEYLVSPLCSGPATESLIWRPPQGGV